MSFLDSLNVLDAMSSQLAIIFGCVGGAVLLGLVLYVILDRLVLMKKRCKKTLKEIQGKYEYLHALLTGQDAQYIQRLEIISRTNLLYVDMHSSYFKRSKEIRDTSDVSYRDVISDLQAFLEENRIKEFKQYLKEHQGLLRQYEASVNQLNDDLIRVIKPEEDSRQAALILKEKYRELKSKFNAHEDKLHFVVLSFEKVFDKIDSNFNEFENYVEMANYDEANALLPSIEKVINLLIKLIDEIPPFVDEYTINIPKRVEELETKYQELLSEGKPLSHLNVEERINEINEHIENGKTLIKKLTIGKLKDDSININNEIDRIFESFDNEVKASDEFNKKKDDVLNKFGNYEKEYIKITNNIDKFKKFYVIDEDHVAALKEMNKSLDIVSKDKRRLDVYIHSGDSSPYSLLIEKVNILEKGSNDFGEKVDAFRNYLASLKNDSESAFKNIKVRYEQLKLAEYTIREWQIDSFIADYKPRFDECYQLIDVCDRALKSVPIDVNAVNTYSTKLNEIVNNIVKEIQENDYYKNRTEEQILLANRDRMKFAEINNLVTQSETLYFRGDYKSAFEMSDNVIKKLSSRDGNK